MRQTHRERCFVTFEMCHFQHVGPCVSHIRVYARGGRVWHCERQAWFIDVLHSDPVPIASFASEGVSKTTKDGDFKTWGVGVQLWFGSAT